MAASALLANKPRPTDADIDAAMNGNICRCATYLRIRQAIHRAAGLAATDGQPSSEASVPSGRTPAPASAPGAGQS
jgi:isoquinoline 1-oxidoreductase alpha subunit